MAYCLRGQKTLLPMIVTTILLGKSAKLAPGGNTPSRLQDVRQYNCGGMLKFCWPNIGTRGLRVWIADHAATATSNC